MLMMAQVVRAVWLHHSVGDPPPPRIANSNYMEVARGNKGLHSPIETCR